MTMASLACRWRWRWFGLLNRGSLSRVSLSRLHRWLVGRRLINRLFAAVGGTFFGGLFYGFGSFFGKLLTVASGLFPQGACLGLSLHESLVSLHLLLLPLLPHIIGNLHLLNPLDLVHARSKSDLHILLHLLLFFLFSRFGSLHCCLELSDVFIDLAPEFICLGALLGRVLFLVVDGRLQSLEVVDLCVESLRALAIVGLVALACSFNNAWAQLVVVDSHLERQEFAFWTGVLKHQHVLIFCLSLTLSCFGGNLVF